MRALISPCTMPPKQAHAKHADMAAARRTWVLALSVLASLLPLTMLPTTSTVAERLAVPVLILLMSIAHAALGCRACRSRPAHSAAAARLPPFCTPLSLLALFLQALREAQPLACTNTASLLWQGFCLFRKPSGRVLLHEVQ